MTTIAIRCPYHGPRVAPDAIAAVATGTMIRCPAVIDEPTDERCGMPVAIGRLDAGHDAGHDYTDTHLWVLGVGWTDVPDDITYGRYICQWCHRAATLPRGVTGPDCICGRYAWQAAHSLPVAPA